MAELFEGQLKVSVVVPAFNVEKYIGKCIESLLNQTLSEIEIIVVNDNSTDSTLQILTEFAKKDSRVKILDNKVNIGVSAARNLGIKSAKGEYIGFVDSDDWVAVDYYEKLYNAAKRFNSDVAATNFVRCGKFNKSKRLNYSREELFLDADSKIRKAFIPKFNYVWNKIYKRDALLDLNIYFPEGKIFEDIAWLVKIIYNLNGFVTVPDTWYFYRRSNGSIVTKRSSSVANDNISAYKEMFDFMRMHNITMHYPCKTGRSEKVKVFGLTLLKKDYYYPNIEVYKLLGLFDFIKIIKNYIN